MKTRIGKIADLFANNGTTGLFSLFLCSHSRILPLTDFSLKHGFEFFASFEKLSPYLHTQHFFAQTLKRFKRKHSLCMHCIDIGRMVFLDNLDHRRVINKISMWHQFKITTYRVVSKETVWYQFEKFWISPIIAHTFFHY